MVFLLEETPMAKRSWIRTLFARPLTHPVRKAPYRARLAMDLLEDRLVPSTFTVLNTLDDSSVGSLRWAVGQANATAGADTIDFDSSVFSSAKTITLTNGQLGLSDTTGATTITGPAAGVTISGNNASRVFLIPANATALISGCTITGGSAFFSSAGGLWNDGTLTLTHCTVTGNGSSVAGGGLYNRGTATLTNCTVSNNSTGNGGGGGVCGFNGSTTISNCTLTGNQTANGGDGGGVLIDFPYGTTTLDNCSIFANSARGGGGVAVENSATATLTNCTVSGNTATYTGGGLFTFNSPTTLTSCTVSGNSTGTRTGGLYTVGTPTLTDTIVAGNTNSSGTSDIGSGTVSGSFNLIGTGGSGGLTNGVNGNIVLTSLTNLALAPLDNYGGPGKTMPPLPGSAAIDAGTSGSGIPTADQRGRARVGATDIGAVESQGYVFSVTGGTPQTTVAGTAFVSPLAVSVSANDTNDPVNGGVITFTAPASGASAALSASAAAITNGSASVTATANGTPGAFTVTATAGTLAAGSFFLTTIEAPSLVVNTTSDTVSAYDGVTSLREALTYAESLSGNNTVTFASAVFGSTPRMIALTAPLDLTKSTGVTGSVTVQGPGAERLTISGRNAVRVFSLGSGGTATLAALTVAAGKASLGSGLDNQGTVTLNNCILKASSASAGGALANDHGTATLNSCTISGNTGSTGGGLYNDGGTLTLTDCTVSGNSATNGGGLYNLGGTATITGSTFSSNSANSGGALFTSAGSVSVRDDTLASNTAGLSGGAIEAQGGVNVISCTLSANQAPHGGGIDNAQGVPAVAIGNSIIAGNAGISPDVNNAVTSLGNNLVGRIDGSSGWVPSDLIGRDPLLALLGSYGGPTKTMPLLPGSPAIDAGASGAGIPTTDQRGKGRIGPTDIGAVESQGYRLTPATGSTPQSVVVATSFANPLALTVVAKYAKDPVNGGVITFTEPTAGAWALLSAAMATITGGSASVTAMANTVAGSYTVRATASPSSTAANFHLTNKPGAFSQLAVAGYPSPTVAGTAQTFTVTAEDQYGNTVPSYRGTITFTSSDPQAVLPASYPFVTLDQGTHMFSVTLKTVADAGQTITATYAHNITGQQTGIQVTPDAAATFVVAGFPSPVTAGTSHSFTVTAKDRYGNIATGYTGTVQFSSTDTKAVLPAASTFTAADAGAKHFTAKLKTAGTQSITATDTVTTTITGTQPNITVNPATATHFKVSAPTRVTAGTAFTITVTALDPFGNVATGYLGTVHFTTSDPGASVSLPGDYTFTAADAGKHTFTNEATLATVGSQTITATDTVTSTIKGTATINVQAPVAPQRPQALRPPWGDTDVLPVSLSPEAVDQVMALDLGPALPPHARRVADW
jgi:parallel beta-helix repeat protein